ncbi:MAG: phage holin family protein [Methanolobus sp.]|nr:phage holin family protein [Methanolobus sp.]
MGIDVKFFKGIGEYLNKAFEGLKPCVAVALNAIAYIMFPNRTLMLALSMVLGAAFMDIITKWVAISKVNGGYLNAVKGGMLSSRTMWEGTRTKIFAYLVVAILTGMSYRVVYLQELGIFLASFVYTIMFLREAQSNIENLCVAGADLKWLLVFIRKKEREVIKKYNDPNDSTKSQKSKGDDDDSRI